MRVLVAGGTGVIGRGAVPLLVGSGHDVTVLARSERRAALVVDTGATFIRVDALDRESLLEAVTRATPHVIVNLLTAIPGSLDPKRLPEQFVQTNRLRDEATQTLVTAAKSTGARLISESVAFAYAPGTKGAAVEDDPLWSEGPAQFQPTLSALLSLERQTLASGGTVLRLGHLYGEGTSYAADGPVVKEIRAGRFPVVGGGTAVYSFLHTEDAARAVSAAVEHPVPGPVNIVDDDPAPVATWLPALAVMVGGPRPKRVPAFLARFFVGRWGVAFMTLLRGASNGRARETLGWTPAIKSWRDGFSQEISSSRRTG